MNKGGDRNSQKILPLYLVWRAALFAIALVSIFVISKYGGRFPYVDRVLQITHLPEWIWGFGGFDGVHYLRIAQNGYNAAYTPAFFPVFPLLVRLFTNFIPKNPILDLSLYVDPAYFYTGLILSNAFFLIALYFIYKLFRLDYDQKVSWSSLIFLLLFPTSFYLGSIYTEPLFLLLSALVLYESRKRNFLLAGIFCGIASATRIIGVLLAPVILIELFLAIKNGNIFLKSKQFIFSVIGLGLSVAGMASYMFYLWRNFKDPLYFISTQPFFGAERSSTIILLPQVIYRYIRIFMSTPIYSLQFLNSALEFVMALVPLILLIIYFKKIRFSYWVFMLLALIVPTLSGSFSSMPRYDLVAFPLLPVIVVKLGKYSRLVMTLSAILGIILLSLFIRGYWVA